MTRRYRAITAAALVVLATTACSAGPALRKAASSGGTTQHVAVSAPPDTPSPANTATAAPCAGVTPRPYTHVYTHVVWIWMENRTYDAVLGNGGRDAPHLRAYAQQCGLATDDYAIADGSLPNYIAATSGSTGSITGDCEPNACMQNKPSLFGQLGQLDQHGMQWRAYAEGMRGNCDRVSHDRYAARHNPAVYYAPIAAQCAKWDVPFDEFATALARNALPAFAFVTPDLCDDGHDCTTRGADTWLGRWLDRVVTSPAYRTGHTVVFVTWDEGVAPDEHIATVVIAPTVKPGTRSATPFTHYSLLRTTEEILGLALLGRAKSATSMRAAFSL